MTQQLQQFVQGKFFSTASLSVVIFAALLVGLETDRTLVANFGSVLYALDNIVIALFALEAVLKMLAHGSKFYRYFKNPWNVFDFVIVVVCLLPFEAQAAAVLRLVRVVRALRLLSALPRLQLLVVSLLRSLPSMGYIGLLLSILFYVYAVAGVFLWRGNDPTHFDDLPTSLLSLFRVVTLEDWTDIMYIQMYGSDVYSTGMPGPGPEPTAAPVAAVLYFTTFVLLGTMIILNLFIGVILNSMTDAQRDREIAERAKHIKQLGHATIVDDLTDLDHQIDELKLALDAVRRRARMVGGDS